LKWVEKDGIFSYSLTTTVHLYSLTIEVWSRVLFKVSKDLTVFDLFIVNKYLSFCPRTLYKIYVPFNKHLLNDVSVVLQVHAEAYVSHDVM